MLIQATSLIKNKIRFKIGFLIFCEIIYVCFPVNVEKVHFHYCLLSFILLRNIIKTVRGDVFIFYRKVKIPLGKTFNEQINYNKRIR